MVCHAQDDVLTDVVPSSIWLPLFQTETFLDFVFSHWGRVRIRVTSSNNSYNCFQKITHENPLIVSVSETEEQERHKRDRKLNTATTDEGCFNLTLAAAGLAVIQNVTTRMVLADDEVRGGAHLKT